MRAARAYGLLAAGAVALAGCAPIPVQEAEAQCARLVGPRAPISGEIGLGVTSGGPRTIASVGLNIGVPLGGNGDPSAAFDRCVYNKSGRMPTRPLYARTDWKG